ncbi:MAG: hypothetical protein GY810_03385 [Aureispira sp.]|nr:hypothetical protein [Aureispira sp.]
MRYFIILLVLLSCAQFSYAQDTIITKKDRAIIVHVVRIDTNQVYYTSLKKEVKDTLSIPQDNIRIIRFHKSTGNHPPQPQYYYNKNYRKRYQNGPSTSKNTINAAILGGGFYGIEYQRAIYQKDNWMINAVVGIHGIPALSISDFSISAQLLGDVTFKNSKHYLEFGINTTVTFLDMNFPPPFFGVAPGLIIGYRMQPTKGFFLRAYFNPTLFIVDGEVIPLPWGGLGLGYSF